MQLKNSEIISAMLDVPHSFSVGGEHFFIYPPTLAKVHINAELTSRLDINTKMLSSHSVVECMRLAHKNRHECCELIAYNTLQGKKEVLDTQLVKQRTEFFEKHLDEEDVTALFVACLSSVDTKDVISTLKIDKDDSLRKRVLAAKDSSNTYVFGGKSVYGALIGAACEKFGWTYDYVLWDISYVNLQVLMADAVTSVYLTDEERKNNCLPRPNTKKVKVTAANLDDIKKRFQ